jgi:hypothetical protein
MKLRAILLTLALVSCRPDAPVAPGPNPNPQPDPNPVTAERCEAACSGLRRAECREGFPTPGPPPIACAEICATSSEQRHWPLACWAAATTRADVLACGGTRCPPR